VALAMIPTGKNCFKLRAIGLNGRGGKKVNGFNAA
jgi:hypothetical protein